MTCIVADVEDDLSTLSEQPIVVGAAAVNYNEPTKGTHGAAGRAAALTAEAAELDDQEAASPKPRRRRRWAILGVTLLALLVVLAGNAALWKWSQSQYYAMQDNGNVVIFQGIPQRIFSLELSRPIEVTDISLDELSEADQVRLEDPVVRSSLEEIDVYLAEVRGRSITTSTRKPPLLARETQSGQSGLPAISGGD